jgi:tryptophan 7-halogenase
MAGANVNTQKIKKVVIAGGGTAGWITAAALSKMLGEVLDITLVESDEIGTVGVGEASIPPMRVFHKLLRIDEQEFMRETEATFKLGISFENWGKEGESYIHSFGKTGKETWLAEFHHFWLRARERGFASEFGDYCYEHKAARENKFATNPDSAINYAYHLDATRYAKFLRRLSEAVGAKRVEGKITEVIQNHSSGFIEALRLDSGEVIHGDLFIDCTGFRGLLIEQTLHTGYEDWTHWLPCDSALAVQTETAKPAVPYTRSIARKYGWQWQIPLQHRVGNGLVFCSGYMSNDDAREELLAHLDGDTLTEPRLIKYRTGRRRKVWNKNCVAIGLSSGFIEPLESTSIHLIMMGVTRLMQLFPFAGIDQSLMEKYNKNSSEEVEKIRDFIVLHYHQTQRDDTPFWRYCKTMDIPSTLADRMALFKENAHAYQADGELFRVDSWTQVMMGQGLMPENYHQITRSMSDEKLQQFLQGLSSAIRDSVEKLPLHNDFVMQYCRSELMGRMA